MKVCLAACFKAVHCFIWCLDHPRTTLGLLLLFFATVVALAMGIGSFTQ